MALIPCIRFPEFSDEWKCTKMSACIADIIGGAPLKPKDILDKGDFKIIPKKAIQAGGKIIISDDCNYVTKETYEKYATNHAKKGDLIIVLRDLVPTGPSIGYIVENDKIKEGILAQGVYAFRTTEIINDYFIIQYSNSPKYRKLMQTIMVGSTQVHINNSVYMNIDIPHGELKEQQKIAGFLSSVDDIIQIQEEKISVLEEQKKGVMQKLFNREVRFKVDDGGEYPQWERKSIGSACIVNPKTEKLEEKFYYIDLGSVNKGNLALDNVTLKVNAPSRAQRVLSLDDVIFQSVRPYNMGHYHYTKLLDRQVVASTGFIQLRLKDGENAFLYQLLYTSHFNNEVDIRCTGSNYPAINSDSLAEIKIDVPCIEEQRKIVNCLSAYDEAIQIKKDKLEVWKEIKKGLLQQMFV